MHETHFPIRRDRLGFPLTSGPARLIVDWPGSAFKTTDADVDRNPHQLCLLQQFLTSTSKWEGIPQAGRTLFPSADDYTNRFVRAVFSCDTVPAVQKDRHTVSDKTRKKSKAKFQRRPETVVEESPWLELKNPHSIRAAITHRPEDVKELVFLNEPAGLWIRLAEMAEAAKIPIRQREQKEETPPHQRRGRKGNKEERTGHSFALVAPRTPQKIDDLLQIPAPEGRQGVWLALDSLQDPHNVGAIFRSASFFGVMGIIVTKNSSAPINATVYDTSAGGVEAVPFAVETNLNRALKLSRRVGLWNLGTSEHAERSVWEVDCGRPWLVVVGNEQKGLRRLVLEHCDEICQVPPIGETSSLNVSVAAGILLAALRRS